MQDELQVNLKCCEPNRNLITGVSNYFGANCISAFAYDNDVLGRRTERLDFDENLFAITNSFAYNHYSEVTNAIMNTDNYNFTFDDIGNRIKTLSTVDSITSEMDYLCNALNQYTNIYPLPLGEGQGEGLCYYDLDGNMLSNSDWTYTWNGENRLVMASNATTIVNFKYDYMGRRFEKSVEGGETTTFIYDGWNPILETIQHSTFSITNSFAWGLDLSGSMQGAGGIGGLLSTVLDGDLYFSCFDANGNVTDYVDETGDIVAHYEYDPFGGITYATGDKKDDFNFRFSTKYLDTETGLYYYGYRYYVPVLGRFLKRDILGEKVSLNLFTFADNTPIDKFDVLGLSSEAQKQCEELKKLWKKKQTISGSPWWNYYIKNLNKCKVKIKCDPCCKAAPAYVDKYPGRFSSCRFRVCTSLIASSTRQDMRKRFVHEITH